MEKTYFTEGDQPESQMGAALESLAHTIHARSTAGPESYTYRLLTGNLDDLLKKLVTRLHSLRRMSSVMVRRQARSITCAMKRGMWSIICWCSWNVAVLTWMNSLLR